MDRRAAVSASLLLASLTVAVECGRGLDAAYIAVGSGYRSLSLVARLAQSDLDSTRRPGDVRIVLGTGDTSGQVAREGLAGEVDHAMRIARTAGVVGVVGHGGSRESLLAAPVYNEAGIPQIVPTGTSRLLRDAGPWTFPLAPNDSAEGEAIGRFAAERLGARSAVIFYVTDEYGVGLRSGAAAALRAHGVTVLDSVPVRDWGVCGPAEGPATTFPLVDAALRRGAPDVLVIATRNATATCIVRRAWTLLPRTQFIAGDGLSATDEYLAELGPAGQAFHAVVFWHRDLPDERSRSFAARFRAAFGSDPNAGDAMFYDGIMALAAAVREVGPNRPRIREYLAGLGTRRPALPGVTGPVSFAADRPFTFTVIRPRDGRFVLVRE